MSDDGGLTFRRHSRVPVLDRTDGEHFFRVIHSVIKEKNRWRVWYGAGSEFVNEGSYTYPRYNVRYTESQDGVTFPPSGRVCVDMCKPGEYRVGRPYVIRMDDRYRMFYGKATIADNYRLGYAESPDGTQWTRLDDQLGLEPSVSGWDSQMTCYPAVVTCAGKTYMFYNGNNYGRDGFGLAELKEW